MTIEIKVPVFPESISEGSIAKWYKKVGDFVKRDEHLLDVETDKVVLEVVAPEGGVLETILKQEGESVQSQEVVARFKVGEKAEHAPEQQPALKQSITAAMGSPSARRKQAVSGVEVKPIPEPNGKKIQAPIEKEAPKVREDFGQRHTERVPMTRIRTRIAERLLQAQNNAAILTTFNEVNMQPIMEMRQKYKEVFEKTHGVRLGFMSFFTVACVEALKRFPIVNATVEGDDILYHNFFDIGIAVSAPRGLVVPVIRDADGLTMAEIEQKIVEMSQKAKNNLLTLEELSGGTFTITNGGVFGSLLSTPIINLPQSAILGMHKIEERPVALNGTVVVRPMMYLALSYDHRIIDGSDSVRFLVTVKEILEDPARLCLGI